MVTWTPLRLMLAGITMGMALPPPSAAQSADTLALADEAAVVLGDSLVSVMLRGRNPPHTSLAVHDNGEMPLLAGEPATPFDARVTFRLREAFGLELMHAGRDSVQWIVTRGAALSGDTATVRVELGVTRSTDYYSTYIEEHRFTFVRSGDRWRYLRRELVSGRDMGSVRG
jgi:hypothetical protein